MMWHSGPWKLELIRMVDRCERQFVQMGRLRGQTWWEDAVRMQQVEKMVFLSAFIVRKLADSRVLSVQVEDAQILVESFSLRSPNWVPDSMNWERLDQHYDLAAGRSERVPMRHLVNWIIHSFVFIPEVRSDHAGSELITGFYCNSDRLRNDRVVRVSWESFRGLLDGVARDDVIDVVTVRDGRGREAQLRSSLPIGPAEKAAFYSRHEDFVREIHDQP